MSKRTCLVVLFMMTLFIAHGQSLKEVDVCVYGGTSAGVIAAYTAQQAGKSVVLIEPGKHLGGLTTGGLGYTDIGNKYAVTGVSRDFYRRIGKYYGKFEQWIFEPHVAEEVFNQYVREAKLDIWYDHRIRSATNKSGKIESIVLENSITPAATTRVVKAKMYIDCSYEGDLMKHAGVSYTVGREDNAAYGEMYNGFQLHDKHQFIDGIDPYKVKGDPASGLLWGISDGGISPTGTGDKKVQAYNFRICLSRNPQNRIDITQPDNYDATRYELLLRVLEKEPNRPFDLIMKPDLMPNDKTDINNNGPFSTDMIGMNYHYPEADYDTRKRIIKEHEDYIKGFLYFVGHDPRMPAHLRQEMLRWGYPKDEYKDNNHWSPQLYVREARRMVGEYVMTQKNCEGKEVVPDGVGMAAYTMDSHNTQRIVVKGMVKNEGDVQVGGFPPYPIAYRSLVPKVSQCTNLLVPVCLSATHIAYGSIRMEPVFMVLAQSSATAAVMAIDKNTTVQGIDVKALQQKLKDNPLANNSVAEILIDNDDKNVSAEGNWKVAKNNRGAYGPSLLLDSGFRTTVNRVHFAPVVKTEATYDVYAYFPRVEKGAPEIVVQVLAGKTEKRVALHPNKVAIEGQTSGEWVSLGTFAFPVGNKSRITITNEGATGIVLADAVLLVPHR